MATFRDDLIRTCFEARRDVTWWERVEPQLRDRGLDPASITGYRQAWNDQVEKTDWVPWQKEAQRFSNAVLEEMRTNHFDRLDVVMFRLMRDKAASEREKLQQILNGTLDNEAKPPEHSRDQGREM